VKKIGSKVKGSFLKDKITLLKQLFAGVTSNG
jgi:hypothetical protein